MILIVDDIHSVFLEKLDQANIPYNYQPDMDRAGALAIIDQYQGLVIRSKFRVDEEVMGAVPGLRFIARGGAGMDNIDENLAIKRGITLLNAPEGNRDAVAEHLIGMLLSLMNNLKKGDSEIRQGQWLREENRGYELGGLTVALIGYGNNGQAMARKLSGFGVQVIAYDKYRTGFSDAYATEVSMEEVVKRADVLSLHIPLTQETRHLVNDEYLFHFRKLKYFLNGARGEIVQVPAVLKALDEGRIRAAAFDVLPTEKFPGLAGQDWYGPLSRHENVLLSPHVAGWTFESYVKIADILGNKVLAFMQK